MFKNKLISCIFCYMINYQGARGQSKNYPTAKGLTNWTGALGYRLIRRVLIIIFGFKWVVLTQEFGLFGSIFQNLVAKK